jgi:hypothetical protein
LDSDNRFTLYAVILISAVASVISASVMAGFATVPAPLFLAEHLGLGLLFRASYKSFGGIEWPFASASAIADARTEPGEPTAGAGLTADATA